MMNKNRIAKEHRKILKLVGSSLFVKMSKHLSNIDGFYLEVIESLQEDIYDYQLFEDLRMQAKIEEDEQL